MRYLIDDGAERHHFPLGECRASGELRAEAVRQADGRQAVHRRMDGVPHDRVEEHARQQDGERLERAPPHEHVGGEDARRHLDRHDQRRRPVEGRATEHVLVECL